MIMISLQIDVFTQGPGVYKIDDINVYVANLIYIIIIFSKITKCNMYVNIKMNFKFICSYSST